MTPIRALFERELLPAFAARFGPSHLVLNLGAGDHAYRGAFTCRLITADKAPGCDHQFPVEQIPYGDHAVDGILLMGVFERVDDPMQAMREMRRVLRPGGLLLLSLLDLGFPWRKDCDRWRLSAGGAAHVVRDFEVLDAHHIDDSGHLFVLQKPAHGAHI